eukprot:167303_1
MFYSHFYMAQGQHGKTMKGGDNAVTNPRFRVWSISLCDTSGITSDGFDPSELANCACIDMYGVVVVIVIYVIYVDYYGRDIALLLFFSYFWGFDAVINMMCISRRHLQRNISSTRTHIKHRCSGSECAGIVLRKVIVKVEHVALHVAHPISTKYYHIGF